MSAALAVLGLLELPEDEVPPEHIWHHRERMDEWLAAVKQTREDRAAGLSAVPEAEEEGAMASNALTASLR